jgi:DNA gyrase subunit B
LTSLSEEIVSTNRNVGEYVGEMSAEQLWETTMNPKTRKLKQITMQDAIDANRLTSVLMGENVPPRREYIVENADKAVLDI